MGISKHRRAVAGVVVAVATAIAVVFAPVGQAAKRAPTCKRASSKTVAQNRVVRVYTVKRSGDRSLYACRRSTGRRVRLDKETNDFTTTKSFDSVRLSGYFVAWASTFTDVSCKADCPPDYKPTTRSIKVYNVRRRRSRTVSNGAPVGGALVLSNRGGVAWASRSASTGPVEIRASARAGDTRVLDSGSIDPKSLAIEITIVSWRRDGTERFARLR